MLVVASLFALFDSLTKLMLLDLEKGTMDKRKLDKEFRMRIDEMGLTLCLEMNGICTITFHCVPYFF